MNHAGMVGRTLSAGIIFLVQYFDDAILFASGDRAGFTTWYFHFTLHQRPDLTVIATDLLHFDW